MTTIMLVEDHHLVRQGIRLLLESVPDFKVVAECDNGLAVMEMMEYQEPDVLVMDLMLPGLNGLEVIRQVTNRKFKTRIIVLTIFAEENYVLQALRNGAMGYVLKDSPSQHLMTAIQYVCAGHHYLCPILNERAIKAYMQQSEEAVDDAYNKLTKREREIFQMVAEGHTSLEISGKLSISARTVEVHRASILRKMQLNGTRELILYALERNILLPDANSINRQLGDSPSA